ncbi:MAG: hypothetical protein ACREON_07840, partial [Gemmatimonadaceae bacterium]
VRAVVNGVLEQDVERIEVRVPELEVTCNTPVTRGETLSCTAEGQPRPISFRVTGWSYGDSAGTFPNVVETPLGADTTMTTWSGKLVLSGWVTASGVVGGLAMSDSVRVTVTPRDWTEKAPPWAAPEEPNPQLPLRPTHLAQLGEIARGATIDITEKREIITTGPNAGLGFLTDFPMTVEFLIRVNRAALKVGSDFYNLQPTTAVGQSCGKSDVVPFIQFILEHEGANFETGSHAGLYRRRFTELKPGQRVEGLVRSNLTDLQNAAVDSLIPVHQSALVVSDSADGPTVCEILLRVPILSMTYSEKAAIVRKFALFVVSVFYSSGVYAQEADISARAHKERDCHAAADKVSLSEPIAEYRSKVQALGTCTSDIGPTSLRSLWSAVGPTADRLNVLVASSSQLRDRRLLATLRDVALDRNRPRLVRIAALRALAAYASPQLRFTFAELTPTSSGAVSLGTYVDHAITSDGPQRLPEAVKGYVIEVLSMLEESETDAHVRYAAERIGRVLRSEH